MLVIASDIHLSDETVGVLVSPKTFSLFASRLRELAYQASWRAGGHYEPVREIDIILLGDILDPLQSTRWLECDPGEAGYVRPWHDPQSPVFVQKVREITRAIIEKNSGAMNVLQWLKSGESICLPPADRNGKPAQYTLERVCPTVRLHYVVGNHDWFYHLPGPEYDSIRAEIIQSMGLSNLPGPFPHKPETDAGLVEILGQYRLVARHGDQYDPMSFNPQIGRNSASLADIYSSEVIYRFPFEVARKLGDELPERLVQGIQRMTNVRPLLATPLWVIDQVSRHGTNQAQIGQLKSIWNGVIEEFLSLDILRTDQFANPRLRNTLRMIFSFSQKTSLPTMASMSRLLRSHITHEHISIARFAQQEAAIRAGQADFVVYGHTHSHEVVSLDKHIKDTNDTNQIYINTGTWATFFDYSRRYDPKQRTTPMHMLTCVALYQDGERLGRRYENWWANFA